MNNVVKNKSGGNYLLIFVSLFLILMLTGCKKDTNGPEIDKDLIKEATTDKNEAPIVPSDASGDSEDLNLSEYVEDGTDVDFSNDIINTEEPKIEDFTVLDQYFKDYTFEVTFDENLQFYDRIYTVLGSYDLNGDGVQDQISALLKQGADESYIEVNGIKASIYPMSPTGEVQIIDLDNRDNYVEIAVFDDGPSGDPEFQFLRYDGMELKSLGSIERGGLLDGQGKLISWFNLSNHFEPPFFSAWGVFRDGKFSAINNDVEQYIGKSYKISGSGFFVPLETKPVNHFEYTDWNFDTLREFDNTEITLLDIYISHEDRTLNWYYIELPDGERGLLYFWIGD